jgi:lysophospholipase L1-like esterase
MKKNLWIIPIVLLAVLGLFLISNNNNKKEAKSKIYYIALGDSIAEGVNEDGNVGRGYADFIYEYLVKEDRLDFYTKKFAKSGYTTEDLKNDIENSKMVEVNGEKVYLQNALANANLITLTIGANNFIKNLDLTNYTSKLENMDETKKELDEILKKNEELIDLIMTYNNKQIIVTGYFNPFPGVRDNWEQINELVEYYNHALENICLQREIEYVDLFVLFYRDTQSLPNSANIHPSEYGYKLIADEMIKIIK